MRGHLDRLLSFDTFNDLVELPRHCALDERFKG